MTSIAKPGRSLAAAILSAAVAFAAAGCGGSGGAGEADAAPADAAIPPPVGAFPPGFLWGTAIAPYAAEGGLHAADWYAWETLCDGCSADRADDGPAFWDRYEVDLANAAMLHTNAIRLGLDWSRLFPTAASFPDSPDPDAVARYHAILARARAHGLNPVVTLHHFATPAWLQDPADPSSQGWEDPATIDAFARFAAFCAREFGAEVDWWITIHEPLVYVGAGWFAGVFPPGRKSVPAGLTVLWNLVDAHARAYDAIHLNDVVDADADADGASAMVSVAQRMRVYAPLDARDPAHVLAAQVTRHLMNDVFLDAIVYGTRDRNVDLDVLDPGEEADPALSGRADWIGVEYDGIAVVVPTSGTYPVIGAPLVHDLDVHAGLAAPRSDSGRAIYPEGLREVLDGAATYGLPIVVTGSGLADADDDQRPRFLLDHLYVLAQAAAEMPIRGYFHRSLFDAFEWSAGFCPRYGLFRVDFASAAKTRVLGEGAEVYRAIIDAHTVPVQLYALYPRYPDPGLACARVEP